ncbi:MAG: tubulin/FtsZ family protein [Chloroflexota bacterium]|nr:tubulin/FtsZ family protein [Chloroflexota bacterium]
MRIVVVGLGQCGSRIADEFARMGKMAMRQRGIQIITGVYAINTDQADLTGLRTIKADYHHRLLIGGRKTAGHGVGKINELGAEVARNDKDKVVDAIRSGSRFYETDAFFLIAGGAGGTGSGALPIIADTLKERYPEKPVYALVVLPFSYEEESEERCVYNTATCLKSVHSIADAVFIVDNQRYLKKDSNLLNNMEKMNEQIASPFYELLCAGEEVSRKNIGARTLDAGDIMQTLESWTVIGIGKAELSSFRRLPFEGTRSFRKKGRETFRGLEAMNQSLSELSANVNPTDAAKAMYLLAAPPKEMNVELVKELGGVMRDLAEDALIRSGDYPRERGELNVTVIFSQLRDVPRIKQIFSTITESAPLLKKRQKETEEKLKEMHQAADGVPSLL